MIVVKWSTSEYTVAGEENGSHNSKLTFVMKKFSIDTCRDLKVKRKNDYREKTVWCVQLI